MGDEHGMVRAFAFSCVARRQSMLQKDGHPDIGAMPELDRCCSRSLPLEMASRATLIARSAKTILVSQVTPAQGTAPRRRAGDAADHSHDEVLGVQVEALPGGFLARSIFG
ncbi:hypothetical protein AB4Z40_32400 [Bosea sp. 2YAB26]|uniref:hypothetical protein n=1 Tax=Bosea sp. 2YAB26 TaxID=3237478 RepID=UPI003F8DCA21